MEALLHFLLVLNRGNTCACLAVCFCEANSWVIHHLVSVCFRCNFICCWRWGPAAASRQQLIVEDRWQRGPSETASQDFTSSWCRWHWYVCYYGCIHCQFSQKYIIMWFKIKWVFSMHSLQKVCEILLCLLKYFNELLSWVFSIPFPHPLFTTSVTVACSWRGSECF